LPSACFCSCWSSSRTGSSKTPLLLILRLSYLHTAPELGRASLPSRAQAFDKNW
jgi:hypothetical protein